MSFLKEFQKYYGKLVKAQNDNDYDAIIRNAKKMKDLTHRVDDAMDAFIETAKIMKKLEKSK